MRKQTDGKPKAQVVGVYAIPYCPGRYALEVILPAPPREVDFSWFFGYQPPAWDTVWQVGAAHFYLSADGEELIGSYLGREAIEGEDQRSYSREFWWRSRTQITRAVLLVDDYYRGVMQVGEWRLRFPREATAIPERLLRLIWVDEGFSGLSGEDAYLEDV